MTKAKDKYDAAYILCVEEVLKNLENKENYKTAVDDLYT